MQILDFFKQPVVIQTIILFAGTALMIFWRTEYRKSKQVNQATREDIGVITKIVEEIKNNLSRDTEILKAQLSITNQHKINLKSAEREALVDYNKKLSAWHFYMTNIDLYGYSYNNYKDLLLIRQELRKREYEFDMSEAHLLVFKHDIEFMNLKKDLKKALLGYMGMVLRFVNKYHYNFANFEIDRRSQGTALAAKKLEAENKDLIGIFLKEEEEKVQPLHRTHMHCIEVIHNQIKQLLEE